MIAKSGLAEYPVDPRTGNMLGYAGYGPVDWCPNEPFDATLRVTDWGRGRSSVKFMLTDDVTGYVWEMFVKDFFEIVTTIGVNGAKVMGRWIVVKRGQNYGLTLAT